MDVKVTFNFIDTDLDIVNGSPSCGRIMDIIFNDH
jgi:hypothetical protein